MFDNRAIALQRSGQLGTYASSLGQEAVAVGIGSAMQKEDILVPSFREHGTQLLRGVTLVEVMQFWSGDERGNDFSIPKKDFPVAVPLGSQAPHAVGVALALKLKDSNAAVVCVLGDGATSKGDFYEALNMAGVWSLPIVFVIDNNQWAISVPRASQSAAETLAQKGIAAGIDGIQVDGNDVIAVRDAVEQGLQKNRNGEGPTVIEAVTYRLGDHTTADDASRYREDDSVRARWAEEPIMRLQGYLVTEGAWSEEEEEKLKKDTALEIETAVQDYLALEPEPPEAMFDYLYETLPKSLEAQRQEVAEGKARDA